MDSIAGTTRDIKAHVEEDRAEPEGQADVVPLSGEDRVLELEGGVVGAELGRDVQVAGDGVLADDDRLADRLVAALVEELEPEVELGMPARFPSESDGGLDGGGRHAEDFPEVDGRAEVAVGGVHTGVRVVQHRGERDTHLKLVVQVVVPGGRVLGGQGQRGAKRERGRGQGRDRRAGERNAGGRHLEDADDPESNAAVGELDRAAEILDRIPSRGAVDIDRDTGVVPAQSDSPPIGQVVLPPHVPLEDRDLVPVHAAADPAGIDPHVPPITNPPVAEGPERAGGHREFPGLAEGADPCSRLRFRCSASAVASRVKSKKMAPSPSAKPMLCFSPVMIEYLNWKVALLSPSLLLALMSPEIVSLPMTRESLKLAIPTLVDELVAEVELGVPARLPGQAERRLDRGARDAEDVLEIECGAPAGIAVHPGVARVQHHGEVDGHLELVVEVVLVGGGVLRGERAAGSRARSAASAVH